MTCGYQSEVLERYLGICLAKFSYPCGIKWCSRKIWRIRIWWPCGLIMCSGVFPYPCLKWRRVTKVCYDFSSVQDSCYGVYEKHYGCCGGKEYTWSDGCVGSYGQFSGFVTVCLDEEPQELGSCMEGNSIPVGGQVPGVVPSFGAGGEVRSGLSRKLSSVFSSKAFARALRKLGACGRCMRLSLYGAIISWLTYPVAALIPGSPVRYAQLIAAVAFTGLASTHLVAFFVKRMLRGRDEEEGCGCGGSE